MFLDNSRYLNTPKTIVTDGQGREVSILKRRALPSPPITGHTVQNHDRLDLIAHENYGDATKFWHIADANTELEANTLIEEPATTINVPTS